MKIPNLFRKPSPEVNSPDIQPSPSKLEAVEARLAQCTALASSIPSGYRLPGQVQELIEALQRQQRALKMQDEVNSKAAARTAAAALLAEQAKAAEKRLTAEEAAATLAATALSETQGKVQQAQARLDAARKDQQAAWSEKNAALEEELKSALEAGDDAAGQASAEKLSKHVAGRSRDSDACQSADIWLKVITSTCADKRAAHQAAQLKLQEASAALEAIQLEQAVLAFTSAQVEMLLAAARLPVKLLDTKLPGGTRRWAAPEIAVLRPEWVPGAPLQLGAFERDLPSHHFRALCDAVMQYEPPAALLALDVVAIVTAKQAELSSVAAANKAEIDAIDQAREDDKRQALDPLYRAQKLSASQG